MQRIMIYVYVVLRKKHEYDREKHDHTCGNVNLTGNVTHCNIVESYN
jgi:hypothetical protein